MRQRQLKPAIPVKRQGYWYLERRVPARFVVRDPRKTVKLSTGIRITDDPRGIAARRAVAELDAELSRLWEGDSKTESEADIAYRKASRKALEMGVGYLPAARVAALPTDDLLKRIELLIDSKLGTCTLDVEKRTALAGKIPLPQVHVSQMVVEFEKIHAAVVKEKSVNEKRKWRVPKETALATFIKVIGGDRPLSQLTRADVLLWRQHWQDRALNNEVEIATANKNIGRIAVMYNQINEHGQLGLPEIFRKAGISGEKDTQRVAFEARHVQDNILAAGVLDDLNDEARAILQVMAETGLRVSEVCNLGEANIHLDAEIPFVSIKKGKTSQAVRDVPLVGVALEALKRHPTGFPRYFDKADSLSATVNKFLELRKLLVEEGQSLYSLRHTFEDRLQEVEAPEKVITYLMGHQWHREKYGKGPKLEQKAKWMKKIAFASSDERGGSSQKDQGTVEATEPSHSLRQENMLGSNA